MPLIGAQLTQLKTEATTDPTGLGLVTLWNTGNDDGLAAALNLPRATIVIRRTDVQPREVLMAIDVRDFQTNLTGTALSLAIAYFESVTQGEADIRLSNDNNTDSLLKDNLDRLVTDTNGSQTRLDAIARRQGSRAEQIWGRGASVDAADIGRARQG